MHTTSQETPFRSRIYYPKDLPQIPYGWSIVEHEIDYVEVVSLWGQKDKKGWNMEDGTFYLSLAAALATITKSA